MRSNPYHRFEMNGNVQTKNGDIVNLNIQIGERICLNHSFNANSSENSINDAFRDMLLIKGYNEVKDQTRHGISIFIFFVKIL